MQDRLKPRYSGRVSVPRTAGPIVLGLELPVYQRYENSLHVASKDRIKNLAYPAGRKIEHVEKSNMLFPFRIHDASKGCAY